MDAKHWNLDIRFYYGELERSYDNPNAVIWDFVFRIPFILLWRYQISQWLFNRRDLERRSRFKVLKDLVEHHLESDDPQSLGPMGYLTRRYGRWWANHPQNAEAHRHFLLILQSLEHSGDLESTNDERFNVLPQAISTLASYEEEERRHSATVRTQFALIVFTAILALVAVVDLISKYR